MSSLGELRTIAKQAKAQRGQPKVKKRYKDNKAGFLFLLPWLIGIFGFTAGPMLASLYLAFTNYNLLQPPTWVGFDNFIRMWNDPRLWTSLEVTIIYVFVGVPILLALALAVAVLLDKGMRGLSFYRSIFYLPSLMGGSVAIAILWRQVFGYEGLVNGFLSWFGIQGEGWVAHPDYALWTLIALNVWTFGSPMVIFLAGLRQIPDMYYEAAEVDGASRVRQFFTITLPLLTPIIFFNLVLQIIFAFQNFTQAYVVSGGTGGPSDSTLFFTLYLYQQAFNTPMSMGYASAMAWVLVLLIGIFTAVNFWLSKYWVFYDD
ncbi:carbohydrate ABC transporter permease [Nesterenkonia flava]|uniref:Sugar ABC transporter permease n=1 Tax=Nesterenkonia flava TaxID=469799 RepID=A0ABU1FWM4_9MICC|nr:sugar ABC transporter permease [Nesterenkonia flava]MDR5712875.1 sugar ABC transporter permease [Nesterenkonia flava]